MRLPLLGVRGAILAVGVIASVTIALAADHAEAPGTKADPKADITDYYTWHHGEGADQRLVVALCVDGLQPGGLDAEPFDRDVLYGMHIDTDADNAPDHTIWVRFGQKPNGDWGIKVDGIPGVDGAVTGAVGEAIASGEVKVWAGLRDDPFFMDLEGFEATLMTGTLSFNPVNDFFKGRNVNAIVIELPTASLGATSFGTWAETRRI